MAKFDSLSPEERVSYYRDLEAEIVSLVNQLDAAALSAKDRGLVLEFATHNELGLALEWLYDALVGANRTIEPGDAATMGELARRMDLHSRDWDSIGTDTSAGIG